MNWVSNGWLWCATTSLLLAGAASSAPTVTGNETLEAQPPALAAETAAPTAPATPDPAQRLREGSILKNLSGTFQLSGDRVTFSPGDREAALPVLENLALERVADLLESAGGRVWSVSGTVTEYRGRNYLLLDRAVVRAQSGKAAPRPPAHTAVDMPE